MTLRHRTLTVDPNEEVIRIGTTYLRIDALVLYAYVMLFIYVAALQGIKKPMFAVYIGVYRQILAPIAVFWVFTRVFDFGLLGIWWGIFLITWSAAVITFFYSRRTLGKEWAASEAKPLETPEGG